MDRDKTFVKLYRGIEKWGWYSDGNTLRVFLHILLEANWEETEFRGMKLYPGDCIFGRKKWAADLGLSERQVRTAIEHLKSTNEITIKSTNKFSVISVVKWEFWQVDEGRPTNKMTNNKSNERPTSDQQPTTHIEYKNNKNNRIDIYSRAVDHLNERTGAHYKPNSKQTQKHINARLDEGFTEQDLHTVIDKKCEEWFGDGRMQQYLRPETLFGTKFESYLNAPERKNDANQDKKNGAGNREPERATGEGLKIITEW